MASVIFQMPKMYSLACLGPAVLLWRTRHVEFDLQTLESMWIAGIQLLQDQNYPQPSSSFPVLIFNYSFVDKE